MELLLKYGARVDLPCRWSARALFDVGFGGRSRTFYHLSPLYNILSPVIVAIFVGDTQVLELLLNSVPNGMLTTILFRSTWIQFSLYCANKGVSSNVETREFFKNENALSLALSRCSYEAKIKDIGRTGISAAERIFKMIVSRLDRVSSELTDKERQFFDQIKIEYSNEFDKL